MPEYDHPFYKVLTATDIGKMPGAKSGSNEGGPVIPLALCPFFPPLPGLTSNATEAWPVTLELYDGQRPAGIAAARWAYQTRGQSRTPEYRITRGIKPLLLNTATPGDILQFERRIDGVDRYRVTLVRSNSPVHLAIVRQNRGARWGPAVPGVVPTDLAGVEREIQIIRSALSQPLNLFGRTTGLTQQTRVFRDAAFSREVRRAYSYRCAACGVGLVAASRHKATGLVSTEPEAAHIIPVAMQGQDDPRNGLCLCRTHHWAFDRFLVFLDARTRWQLTPACLAEPKNATLVAVQGNPLVIPQGPPPDQGAIQWHRDLALAT